MSMEVAPSLGADPFDLSRLCRYLSEWSLSQWSPSRGRATSSATSTRIRPSHREVGERSARPLVLRGRA
jgi:hypothetical protein